MGSRQDDDRLRRLQTDAVAGMARAQRLLALRLWRGDGLTADVRAAREWMERAAAQGFVLALRSLGEFCEQGVGAAADPGRARDLYARAAAAGDPVARGHLERLRTASAATQQEKE